MTEEHISPVRQDDDRIDTSDSWQVLWWCRVLNMTKNRLEEAIDAVGTDPDDVRSFLTRPKN